MNQRVLFCTCYAVFRNSIRRLRSIMINFNKLYDQSLVIISQLHRIELPVINAISKSKTERATEVVNSSEEQTERRGDLSARVDGRLHLFRCFISLTLSPSRTLKRTTFPILIRIRLCHCSNLSAAAPSESAILDSGN